jgi:hypothetical protein
MENRICKKCSCEKPLEDFLKAKGEYTYKCKQCNREEGKIRYQNMMSKPEKKAKRYEKKRGYGKNWYHTRKQDPEWVQMRKDWHDNENKTNKIYATKRKLRSRMRMFINTKGYVKSWKTLEVLGCTYEQLVNRLESKFQVGMTWENRGKWHIDHMIPLSYAKDITDLKRLSHYSNLQPLWGPQNIAKGDKLLYEFEYTEVGVLIKGFLKDAFLHVGKDFPHYE